MKVEFKADPGRQLLLIETDENEIDLSSYEYKMVLENEMDGVIPIIQSCVDEDTVIYGDITGKMSISNYLREGTADEEFINNFVSDLIRTIATIGNYLIDANCIVAAADYIFIKPKTKRFSFLIMPIKNNNFVNGLYKISEMFITKLPQNSKAAAEKCYNLYQTCVKNDVTLEKLKLIQAIGMDEDKETLDYEDGLNYEGKKDNSLVKESAAFSLLPDSANMETIKEETKKKAGGKSRLKERFSKNIKDLFAKRPGNKKYFDEEDEYDEEKDFINSLLQEEDGFDTRADDIPDGTMILSDRYLPKYNAKAFLIPKDIFTGETVPLRKDRYILGKRSAGADIDVPGEAVSRNQAKLEKTEGSYMLYDMNSKNGTFCNGEKIEKDYGRKLIDGDEISFADVEYFFHLII